MGAGSGRTEESRRWQGRASHDGTRLPRPQAEAQSLNGAENNARRRILREHITFPDRPLQQTPCGLHDGQTQAQHSTAHKTRDVANQVDFGSTAVVERHSGRRTNYRQGSRQKEWVNGVTCKSRCHWLYTVRSNISGHNEVGLHDTALLQSTVDAATDNVSKKTFFT